MHRFIVASAITAIALLAPDRATASNKETAQQIAKTLKQSGRLLDFSFGREIQGRHGLADGRVSQRGTKGIGGQNGWRVFRGLEGRQPIGNLSKPLCERRTASQLVGSVRECQVAAATGRYGPSPRACNGVDAHDAADGRSAVPSHSRRTLDRDANRPDGADAAE